MKILANLRQTFKEKGNVFNLIYGMVMITFAVAWLRESSDILYALIFALMGTQQLLFIWIRKPSPSYYFLRGFYAALAVVLLIWIFIRD